MRNFKVLYFYKDGEGKYIDEEKIVEAIDKADAESKVKNELNMKIGISQVDLI